MLGLIYIKLVTWSENELAASGQLSATMRRESCRCLPSNTLNGGRLSLAPESPYLKHISSLCCRNMIRAKREMFGYDNFISIWGMLFWSLAFVVTSQLYGLFVCVMRSFRAYAFKLNRRRMNVDILKKQDFRHAKFTDCELLFLQLYCQWALWTLAGIRKAKCN